MSIRGFRYALSSCAAAALVGGCGGSQPPIGAPGFASPIKDVKRAAAGDRIFVSADRDTSGNYIFVWSYPGGRFVKSISGAAGIGMCSDKAGNVWLAEDAGRELIEFDRNGSIEKRLADEGYDHAPWGCSVDPSTGNVAAINIDDGDLIVYQNASGSGAVYQTSLGMGYSCAYDGEGDLFGYGINRQYKGQLVLLPVGSNTVEDVSLNKSVPGDASIQWDGQHLAVQVGAKNEHTATIDRVAVSGSTGTIVGTTYLVSPRKLPTYTIPQFWIQGGTIAEATGPNGKSIGLWNYPRGGNTKQIIEGSGGSHTYYIDGLTVSAVLK